MAQNMEKLGEIMQYVQISQQMGPMGQMVIKQETLLDYIADQLAIPAEIRTTPEERQQIQEMMMQQAQQAAQAQGVMNGGQTGEGNQVDQLQ